MADRSRSDATAAISPVLAPEEDITVSYVGRTAARSPTTGTREQSGGGSSAKPSKKQAKSPTVEEQEEPAERVLSSSVRSRRKEKQVVGLAGEGLHRLVPLALLELGAILVGRELVGLVDHHVTDASGASLLHHVDALVGGRREPARRADERAARDRDRRRVGHRCWRCRLRPPRGGFRRGRCGRRRCRRALPCRCRRRGATRRRAARGRSERRGRPRRRSTRRRRRRAPRARRAGW